MIWYAFSITNVQVVSQLRQVSESNVISPGAGIPFQIDNFQVVQSVENSNRQIFNIIVIQGNVGQSEVGLEDVAGKSDKIVVTEVDFCELVQARE